MPSKAIVCEQCVNKVTDIDGTCKQHFSGPYVPPLTKIKVLFLLSTTTCQIFCRKWPCSVQTTTTRHNHR